MNRKVYLIAGHNGKGTGANGFIDEGAETIVLRDAIATHLKRFGINCITDDNLTPLNKVVQWLRSAVSKKDICVDIHFNASSNASANGSEVFIPANASTDEITLAYMFSQTIAKTLNTTNRGVKDESQSFHKKIAMLSGFDCVNVLLEICFVSNQSDSNKYKGNKNALAEELAVDILDFIRYNK